MLVDFVQKKMEQAKYKLLEDGTYFGEIPGLQGVWGNARKLEDCRRELQEVLEDWLLLKVSRGYCTTRFKLLSGHGFNRAETGLWNSGFSR
ncbi:MAG: type II toxin-antitoxin system HicB family antitoxin [Acidobacteria bacterium]|nr:type II toxin-antitoxin system HicB family antitoxin [Acidobacteriota bacterium]